MGGNARADFRARLCCIHDVTHDDPMISPFELTRMAGGHKALVMIAFNPDRVTPVQNSNQPIAIVGGHARPRIAIMEYIAKQDQPVRPQIVTDSRKIGQRLGRIIGRQKLAAAMIA